MAQTLSLMSVCDFMQAYGAQAVVVSIDPRRVYVTDPASTQRPTIQTAHPGPNGEQYCW